jgi:hypothetical protein
LAKPPPPEPLPAPPEIDSAVADLPPAPDLPEPEVPPAPNPPKPEAPPAAPEPQTARAAPDVKPVAVPKVEEEDPPVAEQPPVPQLTELIPDDKKWEYAQEVDRRLLHINQLMAELENRPLNEEQMALLDRVRVFTRQTTEARETDLVTARNLSERAELLAEELERATR